MKRYKTSVGLAPYNRRRFLSGTLGAVGASLVFGRGLCSGADEGAGAVSGAPEGSGFKIGVCDWTLKKRNDRRALELAGRLGIDGVQVDFGGDPESGEQLPLMARATQLQYLEAEERTGVAIASLAMGILNKVPYKSDERATHWVEQAIGVAQAMKQKVLLLAFFGEGDLVDDAAGRKAVAEKLKALAPRAEDAGVVIGIESWLKTDLLLPILEEVGSPSVQVYYDVGNMHKAGADIFAEMREYGRERICEVHAKDNKDLYGRGEIDFPRVRDVLDEIGYAGWIVMEGTKMPLGVEESNRFDADYLRTVFS